MNEHRHFGGFFFSAVVGAAALAVAGASSDAGRRHPGAVVGIPAAHCAAGSFHRVGTPKTAFAAIVRKPVTAFRRPGRGALARFGRENTNRFPTVFGIRAAIVDKRCAPIWYRVQLPIKPNGITGYVRAAKLDVGRVHTRVVVDVSARRLTFMRWGRPVLRTTVAVGSRATPTPRGWYYVNQRLIPSDRSGAYGPAALGISAFSPVLTGWTQGGPIAIHGTNQPWSIGRAVSNGCIRVHNSILRRLYAAIPAGTPVVIRE